MFISCTDAEFSCIQKVSFKLPMKCKTENLYSHWRFRVTFRSILPQTADKRVLYIFVLYRKPEHTNTWEKPLHSLDVTLQHLLQLLSVGFQFSRLKVQMFHNPLEKFSLYMSILLQEIWAELLYRQCWHWTPGRCLSFYLWNMVIEILWLCSLHLTFYASLQSLHKLKQSRSNIFSSFNSHMVLKSFS